MLDQTARVQQGHHASIVPAPCSPRRPARRGPRRATAAAERDRGLYFGNDHRRRRQREPQEGILDPPHVRGGRPPEAGARRGQGLRLHAGQPGDRAAARRARRRPAGARQPRAPPARLHAERGPRRGARGGGATAERGHRAAVHGGPRDHDGGRGRGAEHRAQGASRPRRRGHHRRAVLRRVRVLRGEPRGPARRRAAPGRPDARRGPDRGRDHPADEGHPRQLAQQPERRDLPGVPFEEIEALLRASGARSC